MSYIDGFVAAVPVANKAAYLAHAEMALPMFREAGATRVVETWADDVHVGKVTDFRRAVAAEEGEEVVFSWIEWPSREVRDAGWARLMDNEQLKNAAMPFDGKRMIYGGFATILDA